MELELEGVICGLWRTALTEALHIHQKRITDSGKKIEFYYKFTHHRIEKLASNVLSSSRLANHSL